MWCAGMRDRRGVEIVAAQTLRHKFGATPGLRVRSKSQHAEVFENWGAESVHALFRQHMSFA